MVKFLNIAIIYACLLISGPAYPADSDAPTIKDLAEKKQAKEEVIDIVASIGVKLVVPARTIDLHQSTDVLSTDK